MTLERRLFKMFQLRRKFAYILTTRVWNSLNHKSNEYTNLRNLGSNQLVVRSLWFIKYISPSGVTACSQPSGSCIFWRPCNWWRFCRETLGDTFGGVCWPRGTLLLLMLKFGLRGSCHVVCWVTWLKERKNTHEYASATILYTNLS
jgi:hypothetical protein